MIENNPPKPLTKGVINLVWAKCKVYPRRKMGNALKKFFDLSIDKFIPVCYNKTIKKRKEVLQMETYYIYINRQCVVTVLGCEAAWAAYRAAVELIELTDGVAELVWETGGTLEVIAGSDD